MLRITHVEEIAHLLLASQALFQQQAERAFSFPDNALAWLKQVEQVLTTRGLFQAASIAALRSEIVSAQHGQVPPSLVFKGSVTRSKIRSAVAAQAVQRAVDVVTAIVQENQPRFRMAEERMQQLVAVAFASGLIPVHDQRISRTDYLLDLRKRLLGSPYGDAVIALDSLVGPNDMLVMLDRALLLRNVVPVEVPSREQGGHPPAGAHGPPTTTPAHGTLARPHAG